MSFSYMLYGIELHALWHLATNLMTFSYIRYAFSYMLYGN